MALRSEGSSDLFAADAHYRYVLHRLWIAAGNEALASTKATSQPFRPTGPGPPFTICVTI